MNRSAIITLAISLLLACESPVTNAADVLYFTSTPGSWVGQGQTLTVNGVSVSRYYDQGAYTNAVILTADVYQLSLVGPNQSLPSVGFYDDVTRWPFMATGAGMWFTALDRGDNVISGWFNVLQADYSPIDGSVLAFAVDFKQYDEGSPLYWTQGSVRYNSSIPVPEPASAVLSLMGVVALMRQRRL